MLEEEGIIKTISNVKSVVIVTDELKESIKQEFMQGYVVDFIDECKSLQLSFQEVIALLNKYW